MLVLFKNAHIVDPLSGKDEVKDLLVSDGVIEKIGGKLHEPATANVVDLAGRLLAPGFLDMHVHTREPGYEHKETIDTVTASAAAGGFTAICAMPNTNPPIDDASVVEYLKRRAKDSSGGLVDLYCVGAATKGREGKELAPLAELAGAGAVAFSDDGAPISSAEMMRRALEYSSMLGCPIIQHAEESSLTRGGAINEGLVSTTLGLPSMPAVAEDIMVDRDVRLVEYVCQSSRSSAHPNMAQPRYHLAHLSTAASVEIIRGAKKRSLPVTCEVTPHHFTLTDEAVSSFDTNTKMNPPLRTPMDVEAIKEGLRDGTIDAIATDHAPHSYDEKQVEYSYAPFGIIGLETAVGLAVTYLLETGILSIWQLIEKFSTNPRRILSLPQLKIMPGERANFTIIDLTAEWTVDVNAFKSKSKNSPFHGFRLKGKPLAVYNNSVLRYC